MARADKAAAVAELAEQFRTSNAAVLTEYRGLTVAQLKTLRRSLGANADLRRRQEHADQDRREGSRASTASTTCSPARARSRSSRATPVEAAKGLRDFAKEQPAPGDQGRRTWTASR